MTGTIGLSLDEAKVHKVHLAIVPPTTTHHAKRIVRFGGFTRLADSAKLKAAMATYEGLLLEHKPADRIRGPISLDITFVWPHLKSTPKRLLGEMIPKVAKPDCDNLSKTLTDAMARAFWFNDDAEIYSMSITKYHGPDHRVGVWIEIGGA